ncbi:hypothetical protein KDA23_01335 [Candidatus Saccharibacteria bacterium]|nr:hypothetical protein [Candidatus Saccharibacteria bacterium]
MFIETNYLSQIRTPDFPPPVVTPEPAVEHPVAMLSDDEKAELAMMACAHIHDLDDEADRVHDENVRRRRLEYHIKQSPNVLPLPSQNRSDTPVEQDQISHTA